jgi:hypothetical protein
VRAHGAEDVVGVRASNGAAAVREGHRRTEAVVQRVRLVIRVVGYGYEAEAVDVRVRPVRTIVGATSDASQPEAASKALMSALP